MPARVKTGWHFFLSHMDINSHYKIGYILKSHGLKGEVTISIDAEAPENFESLKSVFVLQNNQLIPFFIESISMKGGKAFVKFEDVNSIDSASALLKCGLFLPKSSRAKSGRGEFYDDEIVGFEVADTDAGIIGVVQGVLIAGPNKLLRVDHDGKEVLIPLNSPFIKSINKGKKKVGVELPEGFLDI
jgi:16S rRNA processing protein RimM